MLPGEGGLDHGVGAVGTRARVHDDVVDLVVAVEVVIEEQVTGLRGRSAGRGSAPATAVSVVRGMETPAWRPGPLHEARAVEADAGLLAAEDVGHAQLRDRGLDGRHLLAVARARAADRPDVRGPPGWRRWSPRRRCSNRRPRRPRWPRPAPRQPPVAAAPRSPPAPRPPLPAVPLRSRPARPPGPVAPAPGSGSPSSPPPTCSLACRERLGLRGLGLRLRGDGLLLRPPRFWSCVSELCERGLVLGQVADDLVGVLVARLVHRGRRGEVGREAARGRAVDVGRHRVGGDQLLVRRDLGLGPDRGWRRAPAAGSARPEGSARRCCTCRRGWRSAAPPGSACSRSAPPCDWVALICDWFGAGPGSVVGVGAAPASAATSGATSAPSIPATIAARVAGATPADSAPTSHCTHPGNA